MNLFNPQKPKRRLPLIVYILVLILLFVIISIVFKPQIARVSNSTGADMGYCLPIDAGVAYLTNRYDPVIGLMNESPNVNPHKYWLTQDNVLAAFIFTTLGETSIAENLNKTLESYDQTTNGLIEVLWSEPITIPPLTGEAVLIESQGPDEIWFDSRLSGDPMPDWAKYADLSFYAALNQFYNGDPEQAKSIYQTALIMFDGTGFVDEAFDGNYETYKTALAVYTGLVLGEENPYQSDMLSTLYSLQAETGGYFTHYNQSIQPAGDTNTETTSFVILALHLSGCE